MIFFSSLIKLKKMLFFLQAQKADKNMHLVFCKLKKPKNVNLVFCKLKKSHKT
eukprot:UN27117